MTNIATIFFVSESEYPKLQAACPEDFPFTYEQFVQRVEEGIRHTPEGFAVVKINADIAEFLLWCTDAKIEPNNIARAKYAAFVYAQSTNPITHA